MNSRDENNPFRGGRQESALYLGFLPIKDPYATWRVEPEGDTGIILPTRKIPPKRKSFSGYVPFPEFGRIVWYESLLEQAFLLALRHLVPLPGVLEQPMALRLRALGFKGKKYTPDFLVWTSEIRPTLIEVKYEEDLKKDWTTIKPKLMAARRYARWRGWGFRLVTDRHLLAGGVRRILPTETGLISPYRRIPGPSPFPIPRPVIWGALPGLASGMSQVDRSHLLIPSTGRLMSRILACPEYL